MKIKKTREDIIMDIGISIILIIFAFICLYPIWFVLMASFSVCCYVPWSATLAEEFHIEGL